MTQNIESWEALAATGRELAEAVAPLDAERLARLSPADRQAQLDARMIVYTYCGDLWHSHKREGLDPHESRKWAAAGALYDLFNSLSTTAHAAVHGSSTAPDVS